MKNTLINRIATVKVARALDELCDEVVFVGGVVVSLYIDDPSAEDIRPTKDIDLTFQITSVSKLESIRVALIEKGFREASDSKVTCRFKYEDLLVDVMSTQQVGWAPANRWFKLGFERSVKASVDDVKIQLLPLPYFLATKFDAFFERGSKDMYASKDLEDIVYLFNHTSTIVKQVFTAPEGVRDYLIDSVKNILNDPVILSAIPGHLFYENAEEQLLEIRSKLQAIVNGI